MNHPIMARLRRFSFIFSAGIGLVLLSITAVSQAAPPAATAACLNTITVTNDSDSGAGSLRQAVYDVCTDGTINFDSDYTIYLQSTLNITGNMKIDGSNYDIVLSGDSNNDLSGDIQVVQIDMNVVATMTHLSIVRGNADSGGGVVNLGSLTLFGVALLENEATGMFPEGAGGAIKNSGELYLINSTVSGNSATNGGGVFIGVGTAYITHTTIADNTASENGAGIFIAGSPSLDGELHLYNSIIADNTGADCGNTPTGKVETNVNNIIEDGTCNSGDTLLSNYQSGDPNLGSLSANAPYPPTHPLSSGSIAIDNVTSSTFGCGTTITADQRGTTRPQDSGCDSGAYELDINQCYVETDGDNVTDYASENASALQTAVQLASPGDTIKVAGICAGVETIEAETQTLYISQTLSISGGYTHTNWLATADSTTYPTTLDANDLGRVVTIIDTQPITLAHLTLQNGHTTGANDDGGGIYADQSVTYLENMTIQQNEANDDGGGIDSDNGVLHITNSTIISNTAANDAGGIFFEEPGAYYSDSLYITNTVIAYNQSSTGGVVGPNSFGLLAPADISTCGGGLKISYSDAKIIDSTFHHNNDVSGEGGGAICMTGDISQLKMENSLLYQNEAGNGRGGAIHATQAFSIVNSTVAENIATGGGGGIYLEGDDAPSRIRYSTITSNTNTFGAINNLLFNAAEDLYLYGTIFAGDGGTNCEDTSSGSIIDVGYNLDSGTTCGFSTGNNSLNNTDPQLEPLADNGGQTHTYAIDLTSPAFDQVPTGTADCNTDITTDQRGEPRVGHCDIGAYEVSYDSFCAIETTNDNTTDYLSTDASALQTAVNAATANSTLKIAGTCAGVTHTSGLTQTVYISQSLTLAGGYTPADWDTTPDSTIFPTILDAQNSGRVLTVKNPGTGDTPSLTLSHLTLQNGNTLYSNDTEGGGGMYAEDVTLYITDLIIQQNTTDDKGGGVGMDEGTFTMINSQVISNTAAEDGGGLTLEFSNGSVAEDEYSAIISGTRIAHNTAGTGIVSSDQAVDLYGPLAISNLNDCGGGVEFQESRALVENSIIEYNEVQSGDGGGGICFNDSTADLTVNNSLIAYNNASGGVGGAIRTQGELFINNSTIYSNTALSYGGLYYNANQSSTIQYSALISNVSQLNGADNIYVSDGSKLVITGTIVTGGSVNCGTTFSGRLYGDGYNIDSGDTCDFSATGSLTDTAPLLTQLTDFGGPTMLFGLASNSPARNVVPSGTAGCGTDIASDQIGTARPQNHHCEIGPFEVPAVAASLTLSSTTDLALDWTAPSGTCTYDLLEGTTPYFVTDTPAYSTIAAPYAILLKASDTATNYFYTLQATCNGQLMESNRLGEFDFSLEPGTMIYD